MDEMSGVITVFIHIRHIIPFTLHSFPLGGRISGCVELQVHTIFQAASTPRKNTAIPLSMGQS